MVPKIFLNYNTEFKQKAPEIAAEAAIERAIEAAKSEEVKKVAVEKMRVEKEGAVNKVATKSAASKGAEAAIVAEQVVSADDAVPVEATVQMLAGLATGCLPLARASLRGMHFWILRPQAAQRARIFGSLVVITIAAVCAFSALAQRHQVCPL